MHKETASMDPTLLRFRYNCGSDCCINDILLLFLLISCFPTFYFVKPTIKYIYRLRIILFHNLSHDYGITAIPSVTVMSYGPVGYVPTLAISVTENIGFLVIPINLIIMLVVSRLVSFNAMLSMYAFRNKPKKKKDTSSSSASFSGLGLIGVATGLFAACPTCASLFIFNFLLGSFASAVAAFTVAFYTLFVAITIPLLLVTPIMTAIGMRRMQSTNTVCTR